MGVLYDQISNTLLPGMYIPKPLELLFKWLEDKGQFEDVDGSRIGMLCPREYMEMGKTEPARPGGTDIDFFAEGNKYWRGLAGVERQEMVERICVFARTGWDGSNAAFWIDDEGIQRIVHLGSGSGSMLFCVLATDPIDFLRLIAIGYDEICRNWEFSKPPNQGPEELFIRPNTDFQNWVRTTFSVTIPRIATKIVKHPAKLYDVDSPDPFCRWLSQFTE